MIKFDRSRIERIARAIVGNTGSVSGYNKYAYAYTVGNTMAIGFTGGSSGRLSMFAMAYWIRNGEIVDKRAVYGPLKNKLLKHSDFFAGQMKHRTVEKSIICDLLEERMKRASGSFVSEEKLAEIYETVRQMMAIPRDMTLEEFVAQRNPNSEKFVESHLGNDDFIEDAHIALLKYCCKNGTLNGVYEFDTGIVLNGSQGLEINDMQTVINEINNVKFIFLNDQMTGSENVINLIRHENSQISRKLGNFVSYLTRDIYSGRLLNWEHAVLETSRILSSHGYGNLCYGNIVEGTGKTSASFSYDARTDVIRAYSHKEYSIEDTTACLIHELGHRFQHKFISNDQKDKLEQLYDVKKRRFTGLKPGDVIEFDDGTSSTVVEFGSNGVTLEDEHGKQENFRRIGLCPKTISKINGEDFLYETDGIPSNYSLVDFDEFVAECFMAWNMGYFKGDVKKTFDGIFGK